MSKHRVLTKEIAEQLIKEQSYSPFDKFTSLSDGAAGALGELQGSLDLSGLANLSPAAAAALARLKNIPGEHNAIELGSLQLSEEVARALAKYRGDQLSFDCTSVELAVLKAFRPFKGQLRLGKVTSLDDKAAAELARRSGEVSLWAVEEYAESPGHLALARAMVGWNKDGYLALYGLKRLGLGVLEVFAAFVGRGIGASPEILKQITTAKREHVQAQIAGGRLKQPSEWQGGRIVPSQAPAKPLKGRHAERTKAGEASWWLPKKVCDWFVQKLDDTHKTLVSGCGGAGKSLHISPEAGQLLLEKSVVWMWLLESEAGAAKEREQASLASLAKLPVPKEFRDGKVSLPRPKKPVAKAHCWQPDFAGEDYQSVLHYYSFLPAAHVGSLNRAKTMSLEAADLYRGQRAFWVAKHAESKAQAKAAGQVQKEAVKQRVAKAAVSAGLSPAELTEKLNRLGELAKQSDLKLVADMVAGFGEAWLYQALLAGSCISPEGDLEPSRPLKRFKDRAEFILVLAVAFMPEGVDVDPSIRRDAVMRMKVSSDNVDIIAEMVAPRLPGLKATQEHLYLSGLTDLRLATAAFLAQPAEGTKRAELNLSGLKKLGVEEAVALSKCKGDLDLSGLKQLDAAVAKALGQHTGELELGLKDLPESIAACLAPHRGALDFPDLGSISPAAAAALEGHSGKLTLGHTWSNDNFTLDADAARHLAQHAEPLNLRSLKRPNSGAALATTRGALVLYVKNWTDGALIALAAHQGELIINPTHISDEVARALAQRNAASSLLFAEPYRTTLLTDAAAEALGHYPGELAFVGDLNMSSQAAAHLVKRRSLGVSKTGLKSKSAARKVFEAAGRWSGEWSRASGVPTWTRNV